MKRIVSGLTKVAIAAGSGILMVAIIPAAVGATALCIIAHDSCPFF